MTLAEREEALERLIINLASACAQIDDKESEAYISLKNALETAFEQWGEVNEQLPPSKRFNAL